MEQEKRFPEEELSREMDARNPEYLTSELLGRLEGLSGRDKQLISEALRLASFVHIDQMRDEGDPYIVHPLRVALETMDRLDRKDAKSVAIALLHDVVEDSEITPEELSEKFGEEVARAVKDLSKDKTLPRDEMFIEYHDRLKTLPQDVLQIKLMDRLDNLRFLHLSPRKEKQASYIRQTEKHYLPLAEAIDPTIATEIREIINNLRSAETKQPSTETDQTDP